jgi:ankyrin repeat protein
MIQSFLEQKDIASKNQFFEVVKSGDTNKLKNLNYLEQYLEEFYQNKHGQPTSILHIAFENDSSNMALFLLEEGAPIADIQRGHPIILSMKKGWKDVTKKLIGIKQHLDARVENKTPLEFAASQNDVETIQMLVDAGATLHSKALCAATLANNIDAFNLLLKLDTETNIMKNVSVLNYAAQKGLTDFIKAMAPRMSDIDIPSSRGQSALMDAVSHNHIESVKALLHFGANPNFSGAAGWTPLIISVRNGTLEITKLLVEDVGNIDLDQEDKEGNTALHYAALYNRMEEFKLLLSGGINYGIKNKGNLTAVQYAPKYESLFIKALEDHQQKAQSCVKKYFREQQQELRVKK